MESDYTCAPPSTRRQTLWQFLCLYGTLSIVGVVGLIGSVPAPLAYVGSAALLVFVVLGGLRAARVSVSVAGDRIEISNQFRTYRTTWAEIEKVELSTFALYLGAKLPALAFHLKNGRTLKAQAVGSRRWDKESMLSELRRLAPADVVVDTDIDSHLPRGLRR
jgi:hypothetical protein